MKITMIGAGSAFTAGLMKDIMLIPGIDGGEIVLVDIDKTRLELTTKAVAALSEKLTDGRWSVSGTTQRRRALPKSDYIINSIEVSGLACVGHDNDIPLKYGIDQCIGDTIGPGGIFKALRTIPQWLKILEDAMELCPRALVLNYTNPMSMMMLATARATDLQAVGLCHSVQGTSKHLARFLRIPYEQMVFECAGVNHLAWFTELSRNGKDLYPRLFKLARSNKDVYEQDPVRFEMMFHFGAFITESSGHLSEYLPYFRKRKDLVKQYCRDGYRGGSRFYASNWPKWRKNNDRMRRSIARDITTMDLNRGHEYAADIIEAHALDKPSVIYGNVPNSGLISNLPQNGVVEVATLVDKRGFSPCAYGSLPPQMAAICAQQMAVYECVVNGILFEDRDAVYHGMMLDPLTAAVCAPAEIAEMTDKMAIAERDYIPRFMTRGLKVPARRKPRKTK